MFPLLFLLLHLTSLLRSQVTPEMPPSGITGNVTDWFNASSPEPSGASLYPTEQSGTTTGISEPPQEDDWSPAENFLYTGDSSRVGAARCSRAYSPAGRPGPLPGSMRATLRPVLDALDNTANFLNLIFQASDLRESSVPEDMEWYHALVRALLETAGQVRQALLTFDCDPASEAPQLVLRASRDGAPIGVPTILLQDLSKTWEGLHPAAPAPDDEWFRRFKFPDGDREPALDKRILLNDLTTLKTPKWGRGDSYVSNGSGVWWAGAPYLDCKDGRFVPRWMLTLSTAFYGLKPDLTPEFRGVIRVDVDIQDIDVDQCGDQNGWFAGTHQCNRTSMECVTIPGQGFRLGQYCCRCKEGYYNPDTANQDADSGTCYPSMPVCVPCWPGCGSCRDGAPCRVQEDGPLRATVMAAQGTFMILVFVSMLAIYRHKRSKRIRASGLLLLEAILFGSLLLYFPVFILYFKPSTFRCILLRWVRMLGFSIVYGTLTLKMYRVLKVFLSRTAQRVPYMSSLHLLRILGVMLMTASWFLCAWTVGVLQNRDRNIPVIVTTTTAAGQGFNLCYLDRWDYMMAIAELLFLCWGSSLWTAVRPVPSAFHEPRYMGIAIHNELILSTLFHLCRFTFTSLHPDWMLLLSFAHTHVTITVTLGLIFIPKFLYMNKPGREEIAAEVYEEEVDLRRSYLNSSFRSAWSERSVDPEDFRDELKRLYTQLEVNKAKKMTANNPHLSKKRNSRCALGRSIIKRIAEIPLSRQCSREDRDGSFRSGSYRRTPDNVSIRSSMKSRSPSLRKSQCDYYNRERDSSLRDCSRLMADFSKRASQRSETDSVDLHPAVCKSVSAQNLTIDNNLLHLPDHSKLHKTWSLISTHSMETMSKRNGSSLSISEQTKSALQSESFDKAEVCPWEIEPEQSDKTQKRVTYANSREDEPQSPTSPVAIICPWDHLPPVENNQSQDKGDAESPRLPVSASAPGSPRHKVNNDQRVFSFRNTTTKWLSFKSFLTSVEATSKSNKEENLDREGSQKSRESGSTVSRSGSSIRRPSVEKRTLQRRSMTTTDGKPCLVKQNAIRLSSGDSCDRSPGRLVFVKPPMCPSGGDNMLKDGMYENLSRQSSKRSSISSCSSRTPSTHRRGSKRVTVAVSKNISHADVCPREMGTSERTSVCPQKPQRQETVMRQEIGRPNACPWVSQDAPESTYDVPGKTQLSVKRSADICPWEVAETPVPVIKHDSEYANICPWEGEVVYENINPIQTTGSLKVPVRKETTKATLFPSTSKEQIKSGQAPHMERKMTKTGESCPWDFPEPAKLHEVHVAPSQITIKADICPWDAGQCPQVEIPNSKGNICPWESETVESAKSERRENSKIIKQDSVRANICPWESGDGATVKMEDSRKEETKILKKEDSVRGDVCPWETEEKNVLKKQDSSRENVCPWETEEPNILENQDNSTGNVCPWETREFDVLKKKDGSRENTCPWETEEPKVFKKRESSRVSSCPIVIEQSKVLKKQDSSRQSFCPWEQEDIESSKRQDSIREDVCPWDVEDTAALAKPENSNVCPWETGETESVKNNDGLDTQGSANELENPITTNIPMNDKDDLLEDEGTMAEPSDVSKSSMALGRRDALCPWDVTRSPSGSFADNNSDVFTWEPENIPEEDEEDDAECAAEALIFPPDL
ncbi:uncharacterized protein gpr179 [Stigmatopora nigra]